MQIQKFINNINEWAPKAYAEDFDNVGLIVGNPNEKLKGVLISLDTTEEVLNEANNNNIEPLNKILEILKKPYSEQNNMVEFQIPSYSNEKYQTFCGT